MSARDNKNSNPRDEVDSVLDPDLVYQLVRDYVGLVEPRELALRYDLPEDVVLNTLKKENLQIWPKVRLRRISIHTQYKYFKPISPQLYDLFEGLLLGRGGLICRPAPPQPKKREMVGFVNDYKEGIDTLRLLQSNFEDFSSLTTAINYFNYYTTFISERVRTVWFESGSNKIEWVSFLTREIANGNYEVECHWDDDPFLRTSSSVQLYSLYRLWYPRGLKRPYQGIELTPLKVLIWYASTGHLSASFPKLFTEFTLTINQRLASNLSEELGILVTPHKRRDYTIAFSSSDEFFNYLQRAPVDHLAAATEIFPHKFPSWLV